MSAGLFERAEALAKQRAQALAAASKYPPGNPHRRRLLLYARRVEQIIVGIGEIAERTHRA